MPPPPKPVSPAPPAPPATSVPGPPSGQPAKAAAGSKAPILIVGAIAAVLIIAGGIAAYVFLGAKKVTVLPSVATAEVAGDGRLFSSPLDSASVVVTVRKGDKVNVIRPPRSRAQEWVEVQYVSGAGAYPAGAMRTANLTNWQSAKPDVQLSLLETFGPGEGATEAELRAQLARYSDLTARIAGTPEEARARLDMARLNIQLARLEAAFPERRTVRKSLLRRRISGAVQNNPDLASAAQQLHQELQTLETATPASSRPAAPAPAPAPPLVNAGAATLRADRTGRTAIMIARSVY